jgi:dihydrofolate reductase
MDDFAISIDNIQKLVFSHTLKETGWKSAKLANRPLDQVILELKQQPGKDILIGSRSLIIQLLNSNLIDRFQICIHPVVEGEGLPLFNLIKNRIAFKLVTTKLLHSGAIVLDYEPISEKRNINKR